jgi:Na+-transporting methylmalonyl-CoA/oxaloacetate decarboxylase gamma subunit
MKSIIKGIGSLLLLFVIVSMASAQNASKLRINEVMLYNETNYIDGFGRRNAWVEIFNSSYGPVNIGGCYLTDDLNNPKKYYIQKGDVLTLIQSRQHVVFFADNDPDLGTFHVNFTLEKRFIALFDANGKTLIDSLTIPAPLPADKTYGRITDGGKEYGILAQTTPSTNNLLPNADYANERFLQNDPVGVGMSITAMSVVFIALALLYIMFKSIGNYHVSLSRKRAIKDAKEKGVTIPVSEIIARENSAEIYAAIAMALYEYENDIHDIENTILTIDKVERRYSPWSSKIYALRETPQVTSKTTTNKK